MRVKSFWVIILITMIATNTISAEEFSISNAKVDPESIIRMGKLLLSCTVKHSSGASGINRVAASMSTDVINFAYPLLYDDGTHGDKIANDGIYSLEINSPASSGSAKIVFFAVDAGMNEIESEPVILNIQ
jgi:hypothetical protein